MLENKVKALIAKQKEKGSKKNLENLVVLLIVLVITIIAINTILKDDELDKKEDNKNEIVVTSKFETDTTEAKDNLEEKLEDILSKIDGVGRVKVLLTYSETNEIVAMYNENLKESFTEETDTSGGTRKITETDNEKEIVYIEENGEKQPVTQKIVLPKIEGAIIVAEGAKNSEVKTSIIQATEAATGLPTHKIQVFTMHV